MTKLGGRKISGAVLLLCVATAIAANAQTYTTLFDFDGTNGQGPAGTFMQGVDGNLYGTTSSGGDVEDAAGTVFTITPTGTLTTLFDFSCNFPQQCIQGSSPNEGLTLGTDGFLYGTTSGGGESDQSCDEYNGCGTIFKITPGGSLSTIHTFEFTDGLHPDSLVWARDGSLYGTTNSGGTDNGGTFFKRSPDGIFLIRYFAEGGAYPLGIIQATDGNFYGTTKQGGRHCGISGGCGTVFKFTPRGKFTRIYSFCSQTNCADGSYPDAGLIQGSDGSLYGTTASGGNSGCLGKGCGVVFKITSGGLLSTLYAFCAQPNCADGGEPDGLVQATDGNLYGVTYLGGDLTCNPPYGCGTIFQLTTAGTITTPYTYEFLGVGGGGSMFQATNGVLYGATGEGGETCGNSTCGTIFSLDMGLAPFVSFVSNSAKIGRTFGVLGQGFTGTTSALLNGISASFTVESDTFLEATVPAGATTGYVTVTTPSGTLTSNVPFHVIP